MNTPTASTANEPAEPGTVNPPPPCPALEILVELASHIFDVPAVAGVRIDSNAEASVCTVAGESLIPVGTRFSILGSWPRASHQSGLFVIRDAKRHDEAGYQRAMLDHGVASVLGATVREADGQEGLLCLLGREPRRWTAAEKSLLRRLAESGEILPLHPPAVSGNGNGPDPEAFEQLHRFFEESPEPAVIVSPKGAIVRSNAAFAQLFGFDSADLLKGQDVAALERAAGKLDDLLKRLRAGEANPATSFPVTTASGTLADVRAIMAATRNARGDLLEVRGYLHDISEERRIELELKGSKELWGLVETATRDVVWTWDMETGELTWNNAGPRCFRYYPAEMRHSIDWHVQRVHPDDRDRLIRSIHTALQGLGTQWAAEYRFRRGDGSYASVLDRACIVRTDRGDPARMIGWMLDISIWRDAEEAIRFLSGASMVLESTLDLHEAVAGMAEATVPYLADYCRVDLLDEDGELEYAACFPSSGKTEPGTLQDFIVGIAGKPALDGLRTVLETQEYVLLFAPQNGESGTADASVYRPGEPKLVSLLLVPIAIREAAIGVLTVGVGEAKPRFSSVDLIRARELARRTGLAVENCRLYETAQRAVLDRDELMRFVSHDLKNPLHSILAATALAKEHAQKNGQNGHRWLDAIERAADQMRQLVDDLLDSSSIEAGGFTLVPGWHSLEEAAQMTCDMLRPMAETKSIQLDMTVDQKVPRAWIDYQQFLRVLINLVGNAIKFSGRGGHVTLRVGVKDDEGIVTVSDSGPGIPANQLANVFTKFWRGQSGDRRGTGLGLSIARSVVEAHGGRIWVESEPGKGTSFYATVPLKEPPTAPTKGNGAADTSAPTGPPRPPSAPLPSSDRVPPPNLPIGAA